MNISSSHLEALKAFGYTEEEARFLYIVATHSGYFVARQFLAFTDAHWGKRTTTFWDKLHAKKHARTECFPKSGVVHHLFSRRLYRQIGRENLRNRREHELEFIRRRIAMLDFVLSNQDHRYLETESEKIRFFCGTLNIDKHFLPAKIYLGKPGSRPTVRYFVDKFPMCFGNESSAPPVVTFTYMHEAESTFSEFVHHLEAYIPLFQQLSQFRFLYASRADSRFEKASEIFHFLVKIPLESDAAKDILRYFQIRKAWDLKEYAALTEGDLIFRNDANRRFAGDRFEHWYRAWKAARVTEANIRQEFGGNGLHHTVHFAAQVLLRVAAAHGDPTNKG